MKKEFQYLIYNTPDSDISVNGIIKDETIWLTQKAMAELFDCTSDNVSLHLKNIFSDGELNEDATTEEISVVQQEGIRQVKRKQNFYNLDAIISVVQNKFHYAIIGQTAAEIISSKADSSKEKMGLIGNMKYLIKSKKLNPTLTKK